MFTKSGPFRKLLRLTTAVAIVVALPVIAGTAMAAQTSGTLAHVQYFTGVNPILNLTFDNGAVIIAIPVSPGCGVTYSSDTIKTFQSIALSALLAGKSINAVFTSCGVSKYITAIDLPK